MSVVYGGIIWYNARYCTLLPVYNILKYDPLNNNCTVAQRHAYINIQYLALNNNM